MFDVILPAGGTIDATFAAEVGTQSKALIPFEGETLLARTLRALRDSGRINRSILVGTPEVLQHPDAQLADLRYEAGTSGPDTILKGLKHLIALPNPPQKILIVTADLPFLSPKVIQDFLDLCPNDRDVCVPLISAKQYADRFPGSGATFIPLREESWTAGCAYVMDVKAFQNAMPHLERVFAVRKSKIGMIKLLGPMFLVKYLTKTLTLRDVERKITSLLQCSGSPVQGAPAELAYDIDDFEDYSYAVTRILPQP